MPELRLPDGSTVALAEGEPLAREEARAAFAKVGVLMASARRTAQALHPTNLHVNAKLFPRDTIQSRLPDPEWLETWLDKQIQFDSVWENKVVERILHNMSLLMERSFASVQELNRFRKELTQRLAQAAQGGEGAAPQAGRALAVAGLEGLLGGGGIAEVPAAIEGRQPLPLVGRIQQLLMERLQAQLAQALHR